MKADPMLLSYCVRELPEDTSWQVIAISKANLPLTTIGLAMGGNARVGLEDTLYVRPKELAKSNAQLVEQLVGVAKSHEPGAGHRARSGRAAQAVARAGERC